MTDSQYGQLLDLFGQFQRELAELAAQLDRVEARLARQDTTTLTIEEIAQQHGKSVDTVRRWIREEGLPAEGRRYKQVRAVDLFDWLDAR